jgi:hypothetical protein
LDEFLMSYIGSAIRTIGTRRVAVALDTSPTGALSVAVGVAAPGTIALVRQNLPRLERLIELPRT